MTVPVAQTRAGTSSAQHSSQLATSDCLHIGSACGESPRLRDHLSPAWLWWWWPTKVVGDHLLPADQGMSDGPQQPLLLLSYGKTAPNCSLMMAAAVPGQNWPHWVELQTACRASCLAQWLWALSRQSCRNVHICHAERRLESLQCSGGLPGNPELPSSGNRRGFGSRKVRPATFTSSERTQKGIKIFSPTSVT